MLNVSYLKIQCHNLLGELCVLIQAHGFQLEYLRNHNVSEARFFRLVWVDNTVDFYVAPGKIFTNTYEVNRKGYWTLFVEFPGDRYAKSPRKIISRDSYSHWIMEVYFYPESVGFSEWHKMHKALN
uniref:Uncharacterized protein n=1 Tax=Ditylenchus dipsaci TaxID=166011 RepID=A0A915E0N8_9BILA